jgi:hypothetical protein
MFEAHRRRYAANRERLLAQSRAYRAANPDKRQDGRLRARFGITLETHREMRAAQGDVCAICQRPEKLHVDHCHSTGLVRGLLCRGCNTAIGALGDCPDRIRAAASYVEATR